MAFELRPYQSEAVARAVTHFQQSQASACIVLPTGSGKSLIIAQLAMLARGRVLVLAHVKELCQQNYDKHVALGAEAGLFVAGLGQKQTKERVTFASVQSIARNLSCFEQKHTLLVVDECHRVSGKDGSDYQKVVEHLRRRNPKLRVLGLTATPFRLDQGWIYQIHERGVVRTENPQPFRHCIYEVTLRQLLKSGYLTQPAIVDAPIAQYDFSNLTPNKAGTYSESDVNRLLVRHPRVTQAIIEQVVELAETRRGVMLFAASVQHAKEIASYLPKECTALVLGTTDSQKRDRVIEDFQARRTKFLVNVSVLTTGFDAPHVDLIAILRPTESVGLFQQIAGRGLRLSPGKQDCLIVDYAGNGINLFHAEVGEPRPEPNSTPVSVPCPKCDFVNTYWGNVDAYGNVIEHYGRRCRALISDDGQEFQCDYRFRFKECQACGAQNDTAARSCGECEHALVDPDEQLKQALKLKGARVLRVAGMTWEHRGTRILVTYHDEEGITLSEQFDLAHHGQNRAFNAIFRRRTTGRHGEPRLKRAAEALAHASSVQYPDFVVARKQKRFFRIQERVFDYQGRYRKAGEL